MGARLLARGGNRHGLGYHACRWLAGYCGRPGLATLTAGISITLVAATLEAINLGNFWILFEDVSCGVAPTCAAIAVAIAAARGDAADRAFRRALAVSLGLTAAGQLIADIPDLIHRPLGAIGAVSDVCYVIGAVLGAVTLMVALYRRLEGDARRMVVIDGLVITVAAMTFVFANWLNQSILPGAQVAVLLAEPTANLLVPLASAMFFASAAAAVVAALSLRIEPSRRGVWAVSLGIVLLALAWQGWIGRFIAGKPDGIEPMDFVFPAGALIAGYGGVTWTLARGGGPATTGWPWRRPIGCRSSPSSAARFWM
jgi:hypothetical protein